MFTIEHQFDATVITLVDEGAAHLQEDAVVQGFDDCVTIEQFDPRRETVVRIAAGSDMFGPGALRRRYLGEPMADLG